MDSPNKGKSAVEQAMCVARALTAFDPVTCDIKVAIWCLMRKLEHENHLVYDQWVRYITDCSERYVKVSKSGAGKSLSQLPEGEAAVQTIDIRGQRPVTDTFADFMEKYEKQTVFLNVFQILSFGDTKQADSVVGFDQYAAARLRMSLAACASSFNEGKIREFRKWLETVAGKTQIGNLSIPFVLPDHLESFSRHLAGLRVAYGADTLLFGSVATASDICMNIAREATPANGPERSAIFTALASYLTTGDVYDPKRILHGLIQRAIDEGFVDPLMEVAEVYRQKVSTGIMTAKAAISIDEYLEKMYSLVPYAHGAHYIYSGLVCNKSRLTPGQQKRVVGIERDTDETLTRLIEIFHYQIMDFDGGVWNYHRNKIRAIRRESGEEIARNEVSALVNRHLIYPEVLTASLLAD